MPFIPSNDPMTARVLRFLFSGGIAATVEYLVFFALQSSKGTEWLLLSQSASLSVGFVTSFLLNRYWVFRSESALGPELVRYSTLAIINLMLGNVAISLLVDHFGLNPLLAKLAVMAMVVVWNYAIFSKLVFRQPSNR